MPQAFVGTSGFSYPHWRGVFYPKGLPQRKWFEYYCQYFKTVELNVSFYRLPRKEVFAGWRRRAGPLRQLADGGFVFSVKGSRFITHIKKLKNCQEPVKRFFEAASGLSGGSANVILWQLPPRFKANPERLADFLKSLGSIPTSSRQPAGLRGAQWRYAFEFRSSTWLTVKVYELLQKYNAAVVFQDSPGWPITEEITADFIYLRFHGKTSLYSSCYTEKELGDWAKKIINWLGKGLDVYAYFNNDALGYAIENAQTLKKLCLKEK